MKFLNNSQFFYPQKSSQLAADVHEFDFHFDDFVRFGHEVNATHLRLLRLGLDQMHPLKASRWLSKCLAECEDALFRRHMNAIC